MRRPPRSGRPAFTREATNRQRPPRARAQPARSRPGDRPAGARARPLPPPPRAAERRRRMRGAGLLAAARRASVGLKEKEGRVGPRVGACFRRRHVPACSPAGRGRAIGKGEAAAAAATRLSSPIGAGRPLGWRRPREKREPAAGGGGWPASGAPWRGPVSSPARPVNGRRCRVSPSRPRGLLDLPDRL